MIISCDSSSSQNSSSTNNSSTNNSSKDQKKEPSFSYAAWSLQEDNSLNTLSSPQWENNAQRNVGYSYQPTVAGLEIDALSGSLKFENLEDLAKAGGQEIRVTAADNSGYSESITLALQVKAHNKAELETLITLFIGYEGVGLTGNYNAIDTSNVKDMSALFSGDTKSSIKQFNGDISKWDTSQVTDMKDMFFKAIAFNQDIGGWNVEKVTSMKAMFSSATAFNQDIGGWNVEKVTDMTAMFSSATAFNQDIGGWNVEKVTSMDGMFIAASAFNRDLDSWNTKSVTDMSQMFYLAGEFNGKISSWNTENVSDMSHMFDQAVQFSQDISGWDVRAANSARPDSNNLSNNGLVGMFSAATAFNNANGDDGTVEPQSYFKFLNSSP